LKPYAAEIAKNWSGGKNGKSKASGNHYLEALLCGISRPGSPLFCSLIEERTSSRCISRPAAFSSSAGGSPFSSPALQDKNILANFIRQWDNSIIRRN
jgi:hypothetical protein